MEIRRISGGNKDFVYDDEAKKRIERVHTGPTRKFVEAYKKWQERKRIFKRTRIINLIIWFLLWTIIYIILIWISNILIDKLFSDFSFYQNKIYYYIFMGICLALFSRVIWTALHKKHFYVGWEIIFWILSFGFLLWLFEMIIEIIIRNSHFDFMEIYIWQLIFIGIGYSLLIKFLRRIKIYNDKVLRNLIIICILIVGIFYLLNSISDINITNDNKNNSIFNRIDSFFTGPKIDNEWVNNFILIVNNERTKRGLNPLKESNQLNTLANIRFNKMMENPFISHYGAEYYNVGEVVFYPQGFTAQDYVDDIQITAPLHWSLLIDPMFSTYGYYIGEGETIQIINSCSTTEIPGPDIDVREFFRQRGCSTTTANSIWLVINMN